MKEIWIIGAGRFGRMAAERLFEKIKELRLVLVDLEGEKLQKAMAPGRTLVLSEGARYLSEHLSPEKEKHPDWIVPAVPIHLAAEWLFLKKGRKSLQRISIPREMDPLLPNPLRTEDGNIFVSNADFFCPDDCAEPPKICTFTGKPRKQNMFERLGDIRFPPWKSLVIRSHQLGAGVGGYRAKELFDLAERVEKTVEPVLISTACRCHGVITGLKRNVVSKK